jgi:hypothetical protein
MPSFSRANSHEGVGGGGMGVEPDVLHEPLPLGRGREKLWGGENGDWVLPATACSGVESERTLWLGRGGSGDVTGGSGAEKQEEWLQPLRPQRSDYSSSCSVETLPKVLRPESASPMAQRQRPFTRATEALSGSVSSEQSIRKRSAEAKRREQERELKAQERQMAEMGGRGNVSDDTCGRQMRRRVEAGDTEARIENARDSNFGSEKTGIWDEGGVELGGGVGGGGGGIDEVRVGVRTSRYEWYDKEETPRTKYVRGFDMPLRRANKGQAGRGDLQDGSLTDFRLSEREIDNHFERWGRGEGFGITGAIYLQPIVRPWTVPGASTHKKSSYPRPVMTSRSSKPHKSRTLAETKPAALPGQTRSGGYGDAAVRFEETPQPRLFEESQALDLLQGKTTGMDGYLETKKAATPDKGMVLGRWEPGKGTEEETVSIQFLREAADPDQEELMEEDEWKDGRVREGVEEGEAMMTEGDATEESDENFDDDDDHHQEVEEEEQKTMVAGETEATSAVEAAAVVAAQVVQDTVVTMEYGEDWEDNFEKKEGDAEECEAVLKLQQAVRGWRARGEFYGRMDMYKASVMIQQAVRCRTARNQYYELLGARLSLYLCVMNAMSCWVRTCVYTCVYV